MSVCVCVCVRGARGGSGPLHRWLEKISGPRRRPYWVYFTEFSLLALLPIGARSSFIRRCCPWHPTRGCPCYLVLPSFFLFSTYSSRGGGPGGPGGGACTNGEKLWSPLSPELRPYSSVSIAISSSKQSTGGQKNNRNTR